MSATDPSKLLSVITGWGLAAIALVAGYTSYGWQGLVLALTVIVFWLLLQFSRSVRVMRAAAGKPVGQVDSAVMLQAKLSVGMPLLQVIKLTRSLGERVASEPDIFRWVDAGGDAVRVELNNGRCTRWTLERAAADMPAAAP